MVINRVEFEIKNVGPVSVNCYIAHLQGSESCIVVDPGGQPKELYAFVQEKGWKVEAILLTHGHFDHIMGVRELASLTSAKVYALEEERELLADAQLNCSESAMRQAVEIIPDIFVRDLDKFEVAGIELQVLATPGHTKGGCCYYDAKDGFCFCGDTIFCESVGRTDLPTGNERELIESISNKLMSLPDETQLLVGHGPNTTVKNEKLYNPYLG